MNVQIIHNTERQCRVKHSWFKAQGHRLILHLSREYSIVTHAFGKALCLYDNFVHQRSSPVLEKGTYPKYSKGCLCTMKALHIHLATSLDTSWPNRNQQTTGQSRQFDFCLQFNIDYRIWLDISLTEMWQNLSACFWPQEFLFKNKKTLFCSK